MFCEGVGEALIFRSVPLWKRCRRCLTEQAGLLLMWNGSGKGQDDGPRKLSLTCLILEKWNTGWYKRKDR